MTEKYIAPNIEEQVKRLEQVNLERKAKKFTWIENKILLFILWELACLDITWKKIN